MFENTHDPPKDLLKEIDSLWGVVQVLLSGPGPYSKFKIARLVALLRLRTDQAKNAGMRDAAEQLRQAADQFEQRVSAKEG